MTFALWEQGFQTASLGPSLSLLLLGPITYVVPANGVGGYSLAFKTCPFSTQNRKRDKDPHRFAFTGIIYTLPQPLPNREMITRVTAFRLWRGYNISGCLLALPYIPGPSAITLKQVFPFWTVYKLLLLLLKLLLPFHCC